MFSLFPLQTPSLSNSPADSIDSDASITDNASGTATFSSVCCTPDFTLFPSDFDHSTITSAGTTTGTMVPTETMPPAETMLSAQAMTSAEFTGHVAMEIVDWIKSHCLTKGEFASRDLVEGAARCGVASLTNDLWLQQCCYNQIMHQLSRCVIKGRRAHASWASAASPLSSPVHSGPKARASKRRRAPENSVQFKCNSCLKTFSRSDSLRRHSKNACTYRHANRPTNTFSISP